MADITVHAVPAGIPYEDLLAAASFEMALQVLERAGPNADTLPEGHQLFVTFRTNVPGVVLPGHLRARFPEEITLTFEHQFEDLTVDRTQRTISVRVSFNHVLSRVVIPFDALLQLTDPPHKIALKMRPISARADRPTASPTTAERSTPRPPCVIEDTAVLDTWRANKARVTAPAGVQPTSSVVRFVGRQAAL